MYLGRKGAGPVYSLEFARALLNKGVYLLCCISENTSNIDEWNKLEKEYSSTQCLSILKVKTFNSVAAFLFRSLNIFEFYRIWRRIVNFAPNMLLSTMVHPWHEYFFLLFSNKVKRVKVIHDVTPHLGESSLFSRMLNNLDIKLSDYWITLSENAKNLLVKRKVASENIFVIPHAHFGFYNKYQKCAGQNVINYRIGFFGRISKYKGINLLLNAYNKVIEIIPDLKLLIAGSGNLDKLNWDNKNIELCNRWIEDNEVVSLLGTVDIVVLPYLEASQSGVIPLAFSLGKPVIVTDVGGLSEQVPNNCGIVVPPNDIEALSKAILYLYTNQLEIRTMGDCAYNYAYTKLGWNISAQLFLSAFESK